MASHHTVSASFSSRAEATVHPLASYLLRLMELKSSNLCLSADVATARELLQLSDQLGPYIVVLKTHHDTVAGWDFSAESGTGHRLAALSRKHGFLIFEDRKLGDIGNTVQLQYVGGSARIIEWAHLVNVNMVPGPTIVTALANSAASWHQRYPYAVRTCVSVGTPQPEADSDSNLEDDVEPATHFSGPFGGTSTPDRNPVSHNTGLGTGLNTSPFGSSVGHRKTEGRKGSIVSVTTVTQHYEPAASPRLSKIMTEGLDEPLFPGIEEAPMVRGLLILAQMSSEGNLMGPEYTRACVAAARQHRHFVVGFVSQQSLNTEPDDCFLHLAPGCRLPPASDDDSGMPNALLSGDGKGQLYNTPQKLVAGAGIDVVIVGRGILEAANPQAEAERYRNESWQAYLSRLH